MGLEATSTTRLRPVTPADGAFLRELLADAFASGAWDDAAGQAVLDLQLAARDAHRRTHFPGATSDVVEVDGRPAGRLAVHRGPTDIRVVDVALVARMRGRGIGTELLRALAAEADEGGRTLSLHVEAGNPARALYERLGFVPASERDIHLRMERPAT